MDGPRGFGVYVFHQQTERSVAVEREYGPLLTERGEFQLGGNGILYVCGSRPINGSRVEAFVVPGYVRYTKNGPAPTPVSIQQVVADEDARRLAKEANAQISELSGVIGELRKEITRIKDANTGISAQYVADLAFSKANDAIYQAVNDPHLSQFGGNKFQAFITKIATDAIGAACVYALTATKSQSRLRAAIEQIVAETR